MKAKELLEFLNGLTDKEKEMPVIIATDRGYSLNMVLIEVIRGKVVLSDYD